MLPLDHAKTGGSIFWGVWATDEVRALLDAMKETGAHTVILYGEVYGQGVQSLHYGCNKKKGFRAFDVYVDGDFLDFHGFADLCDLHGVERVPVLYQGPFDLEKIKEISNGRSTVPGANNIREGVVVRPAVERRDPVLGRVCLKFVSPEYDLSKHKKKDTTDL
jgi:RNA ligase (TIGR02306 family)